MKHLLAKYNDKYNNNLFVYRYMIEHRKRIELIQFIRRYIDVNVSHIIECIALFRVYSYVEQCHPATVIFNAGGGRA